MENEYRSKEIPNQDLLALGYHQISESQFTELEINDKDFLIAGKTQGFYQFYQLAISRHDVVVAKAKLMEPTRYYFRPFSGQLQTVLKL